MERPPSAERVVARATRRVVARVPRRVVARVPCRVDLAGGTLDIWPLGLLHAGARTVNVAVDVPVRVELLRREAGFVLQNEGAEIEAASAAELAQAPGAELPGLVVRHLELPPCEIRLESASPRGGGLGASSALVVGLIAAGEALLGVEPSAAEARSAMARDLEAVLMGLPTGHQDHYPALLGGALEIRHRPGGERVRRLAVDLAELGACMVVAYTGESHFSAATNWQVVRRRLEAEPGTVSSFEGIASAAAAVSAALEAGDLEATGRGMGEEWEHRCRLAEEVSTPRIEALLERARKAGAWGGKACGAGGGGSIAVLAPPGRRAAVVAALEEGGGRPLEASPTERGVEVSIDTPSH